MAAYVLKCDWPIRLLLTSYSLRFSVCHALYCFRRKRCLRPHKRIDVSSGRESERRVWLVIHVTVLRREHWRRLVTV